MDLFSWAFFTFAIYIYSLVMKKYLSLVKFSHTIFAMPFAVVGFFLAFLQKGAAFDPKVFFLILLCMVFARNAAMGFNRFLDRKIDSLNPRTSKREIPAGVISSRSALTFVLLNSALFITATWFINTRVFLLSPIALLVVLGYSYTKRFTWLCHFVLGAGLGLGPLGAYLAAGGNFDTIPILYALGVLFWVAGFDIIYALQDQDFDKKNHLNSIPVVLGTQKSLKLSSLLHIIASIFILFALYLQQTSFPVFGWIQWLAAGIFISLLVYQHTLIKPTDLSKVNLAFFTTNGLASLIFGSLIIIDIYF